MAVTSLSLSLDHSRSSWLCAVSVQPGAIRSQVPRAVAFAWRPCAPAVPAAPLARPTGDAHTSLPLLAALDAGVAAEPAGSGVTSSGVVKQFNPGNNLFSNSNRQAHVITVSNVSTINKKFGGYGMTDSAIHVHKTKFLFEDMMKNYEVPFPCNGTWDRKAWWWLEQNIEQLEGDILFWNIGGNVNA